MTRPKHAREHEHGGPPTTQVGGPPLFTLTSYRTVPHEPLSRKLVKITGKTRKYLSVSCNRRWNRRTRRRSRSRRGAC